MSNLKDRQNYVTKEKNLVIGFCSIRPIQIPKNLCDAREIEYAACLKQLQRVLPQSYDLVICENTIDSLSDFASDQVREYLSTLTILPIGARNNIGVRNKGLGELLMLKATLESIQVSKYKSICYVSARKMFTCPYVFEKAEHFEADALVSNPDFVYLDGELKESHKEGMFNDMFFAMKAQTMKQYADYSYVRLNHLSANSIGSEQNLYNFIHENNISYEQLPWLGLVRNDFAVDGKPLNLDNFHIC